MAIQTFVSSLQKVRTIRWDQACSNLASDLDLTPLVTTVTSLHLGCFVLNSGTAPPEKPFRAFEVFTNLTDLDLFVHEGELKDPFTYLPNLKFLTLGSAVSSGVSIFDFLKAQSVPFKLKSLSFDHRLDEPPVLDNIVPKFLSELESLNICGIKHPLGVEYVDVLWPSLLTQKIALRHVDVRSQSLALLDYLLSYRDTLETLRIRIVPYQCSGLPTNSKATCRAEHEDMEAFVNTLWQKIIPAHKSTLRCLAIFPGSDHRSRYRKSRVPRPWTEPAVSRDVYEQLEMVRQKLNAIEPWGIKREEARKSLALCDHLESLQMGSASLHGLQEAIDVATTLPRLRTLKYNLMGRTDRPNMSSWCGTGTLRYLRLIRDMKDCVEEAKWTGEGWRSDAAQRLNIEIVPVAEMKLVRDETMGMWRLRDKDAIRPAGEAEDSYLIPLEV
ncbi:hypothetical protein ABW21_db0208558 [Orbilia brochopaga]|nr:hypothetical protein ABW21_db0208558 [Drechslerella brochopaga]